VAKGLGGLLGVGREQKRQALAGLTRAAQLETQTDTINRQLDAQRKAAEMNVLGTAGGIVGANYFVNRASQKATEELAKNVVTEKATEAAAAGATTGSGSAMASIGAAEPYVLLAIAGGYLLKKIFD
tara:strand:- start:584 stop:964 length:381 start_codon:yes stop_codon:yes gene_type:complete